MRLFPYVALLAVALGYASSVQADPPPTQAAPRTVVDHEDVAFEVPGRWEEQRTSDGYDLRNGAQQIIVAVYPPTGGLDAAGSMQALSSSQREALAGVCKRGARFGSVEHVDVHGLAALRFQVACEEPKAVAILVAGTAEGRVVSFEHYRYDTATPTPEIARAAAAILATLRIKPPVPACPANVLAAAQASGGACLEAAVLGEAAVGACARELESLRWVRDDGMAGAIGGKTGKKLVCYHRGS